MVDLPFSGVLIWFGFVCLCVCACCLFHHRNIVKLGNVVDPIDFKRTFFLNQTAAPDGSGQRLTVTAGRFSAEVQKKRKLKKKWNHRTPSPLFTFYYKTGLHSNLSMQQNCQKSSSFSFSARIFFCFAGRQTKQNSLRLLVFNCLLFSNAKKNR